MTEADKPQGSHAAAKSMLTFFTEGVIKAPRPHAAGKRWRRTWRWAIGRAVFATVLGVDAAERLILQR